MRTDVYHRRVRMNTVTNKRCAHLIKQESLKTIGGGVIKQTVSN